MEDLSRARQRFIQEADEETDPLQRDLRLLAAELTSELYRIIDEQVLAKRENPLSPSSLAAPGTLDVETLTTPLHELMRQRNIAEANRINFDKEVIESITPYRNMVQFLVNSESTEHRRGMLDRKSHYYKLKDRNIPNTLFSYTTAEGNEETLTLNYITDGEYFQEPNVNVVSKYWVHITGDQQHSRFDTVDLEFSNNEIKTVKLELRFPLDFNFINTLLEIDPSIMEKLTAGIKYTNDPYLLILTFNLAKQTLEVYQNYPRKMYEYKPYPNNFQDKTNLQDSISASDYISLLKGTLKSINAIDPDKLFLG